MKRSEVNQILKEAECFLKEKNFLLPPWAYWKLGRLESKQRKCSRSNY